ANSAGQAALHLARFASPVTLLIRGDSLTAGMSAYLVTQIEAAPTIDVRLHTRLVDGRGESRLEGLTLEDVRTGCREEVHAGAVGEGSVAVGSVHQYLAQLAPSTPTGH